ncbi:MAG TPA: cytochrome c oxidase assembly protein [Rhizomicrobium sp.]|jgi:putative membrane protein|nr:cytochrome c oxidase assembly protein [Rhizomicrobium sp.]
MSRLAAFGGAALAMLGVGLLWNMADILFSAHMAQHLLLIALAAPLLALGGAEVKMPPLAGWGLFVAVFVFWHWPAAFQWAAGSIPTQLFELATILAAAVCFWSGVLGHNRVNDGARALMVMTAAILTDLPGVVMLFAPTAICVMPDENAARFGLTPLADQQLGGLLMWVPANLVFFGIATFLFARWISPGHDPMVTS